MNTPQRFIELDVAAGIDEFAVAELYEHLGRPTDLTHRPIHPRPGIIQIWEKAHIRSLLGLRSLNAIFLVERFNIPRPKALLGDENFRRMLGVVDQVFRISAREQFQSLYLSAAGRDSSILLRLKKEISRATGLSVGIDDGDLLLRLRRPLDGSPGWEVLFRVTPRPLSTRAWRVCDYPGALNAPVAYAMAVSSRPKTTDEVLNIGCGSGTILIERLAWGGAKRVIGCDLDRAALACAQENLQAAMVSDLTEILHADGRCLPLRSRGFDVLFADLPFGSLVGSHRENVSLYPDLLREGARLTRPGGRFVLITHELRLMDSLLRAQEMWRLESSLPVTLRGLHPRIYLLNRA